MKKKFLFVSSILTLSLIIGCGAKEENKKEEEKEEKTEEPEEVSNKQNIETPGYEGTIEGPTPVTIRNHNFVDKEGNVTKFPLIDISENSSFIIEKTTKTLDSLKAEVENSAFDEFIDYAEEGSDYFISRAEGNNNDTLYFLGFIIKGTNGNYRINPYTEYTSIEPLREILEYGKTYQPK